MKENSNDGQASSKSPTPGPRIVWHSEKNIRRAIWMTGRDVARTVWLPEVKKSL